MLSLTRFRVPQLWALTKPWPLKPGEGERGYTLLEFRVDNFRFRVNYFCAKPRTSAPDPKPERFQSHHMGRAKFRAVWP